MGKAGRKQILERGLRKQVKVTEVKVLSGQGHQVRLAS